MNKFVQVAVYNLVALAIFIGGYMAINFVIPKVIYYSVENGIVEAPSNYSIYRSKLESI